MAIISEIFCTFALASSCEVRLRLSIKQAFCVRLALTLSIAMYNKELARQERFPSEDGGDSEGEGREVDDVLTIPHYM